MRSMEQRMQKLTEKLKDPLVWAARRLQHSLAGSGVQQQRAIEHQLTRAACRLLAHQHLVEQTHRLLEKAQQHNLTAAAAVLKRRLLEQVGKLASPIDALLQCQHVGLLRQQSHSTEGAHHLEVGWQQLRDELRQLQEEFGPLKISADTNTIAATTDDITLQGLYLGAFLIELHLDRLTDRQDVSAFECLALDPQPASTSADTTHPHVKDNALCAGDATAAISQALGTGRIADAFMLVRSVLQHYNPQSPYVPLQDWRGVPCGDCGDATDAEDLCRCEDCDCDCCQGCIRYCHACERNCCSGCLEHDDANDRRLCSNCSVRCSRCDALTTQTDTDEQGRCTACVEDQSSSKSDESEPVPQEREDGSPADTGVPGQTAGLQVLSRDHPEPDLQHHKHTEQEIPNESLEHQESIAAAGASASDG
jgi:hypothetical protein